MKPTIEQQIAENNAVQKALHRQSSQPLQHHRRVVDDAMHDVKVALNNDPIDWREVISLSRQVIDALESMRRADVELRASEVDA